MTFVDLKLFNWQGLSPGNISEDDMKSCLLWILIALYRQLVVRTTVRQTSDFFLWEGLLFLYRVNVDPLPSFYIMEVVNGM